jgi:hypothetical protein
MGRHFRQHPKRSQPLLTVTATYLHVTTFGCDGLLRFAQSNGGGPKTSTQSDLHDTPCPGVRRCPRYGTSPGETVAGTRARTCRLRNTEKHRNAAADCVNRD